MPSKAELREKWDKAGQDVVVLHMFPRARTCPNPSPYPIKLETYLRVAEIKYVTDFEQPASSKGKSPWMTFNGKDYADSQFCVEHLGKTLNKDLSAHLSPAEKAVARAFRSLIEDNLYFCLAMVRWGFDQAKSVSKVMAPLPVPGFLQGLALKVVAGRVRKQCEGQGIGRHTRQEVEDIAKETLKAISEQLGGKPYMMGDRICELDCTLFGFTCQLLYSADEGSVFRNAVEKDYPNLKEFTIRIKEKYWPDWEECKYKDP